MRRIGIVETLENTGGKETTGKESGIVQDSER